MTNDVRVDVLVTDNGSTAKLDKAGLKLKSTYEGVAAAARMPLAVSAAQQGLAAKRSAATPGGVASDTNLSRGVAGVTGASGRDFAAQAQGLGGLVHVYATFAANLFAVSAAFTALSGAMDTANLVKGLDQIGASSGKNLGSLAKQMVSVADGAISLRQALTSTAMASSGGMTSRDILRMTEVAKKASLALGRDLPDSMDRLTKGIVKTQPELLDELGIMTRMIPAQQEYARQIGKTSSSLTDFEKRQAFANAVLAEGEKKFGAIELAANPYSKLLSSTQNALQGFLEFINKGLSPVISMLAASPTGLMLALGGIATLLLKQAMPALGQFKEGMAQAAEQAKMVAVAKSIEAQKGYQTAARIQTGILVDQARKEFLIAKASAEAISEEKIAAVDAAEAKIKKLSKGARGGAITREILAKPFHTEADAIALTTLAEQNQLKLDKAILQKNDERASSITKTIEAQKGFAASIRENIKQDTIYEESHKAALATQDASIQKIKASEDAFTKEAVNRRGIWNTDRQAQIVADRAMIASVSQNITAQAAQTGAVRGFSAAWKEARESVKKAQSGPTTEWMDLGKKELNELGKEVPKLEAVTTPAMSNMRGGWVSLKAGISGATGALNTFLAAASPWIMVIGIAIAAISAFSAWMTTSAKESTAFGSAMDTLNASSENVSRTLDVIAKKDPKDVISVESTQAKANALNDLTDSLSEVLRKFDKLKSAQGGWDKFWDKWLFDPIGKGDADKLAAGLSQTVVDSLKLMEEGKAKDEAKKVLSNLFGQKVDLDSFKSINASIKDLDENIIRSNVNTVDTLFKRISREVNNAASALTAFKTSLEDIGKQSTTMTNALIPTDAFSKLGIELLKSAVSMNTSLQDPINSLTALRTLAGDTRAISLLPQGTATDLINSKKAMDELSSSLASLERQKVEADANFKALEIKAVGTRSMLSPALSTDKSRPIDGMAPQKAVIAGFDTSIMEAERVAKIAKETAKDISSQVDEQKAAIVEMMARFKNIGQELASASFDNMAKGLVKAQTEAAIVSAKSYLDTIKLGGIGTTAAEADLSLKSIAIQLDVIKSQYSMAEVLQRNVISTDRLADETQLSYLTMNQSEARRKGIDTTDIDKKIQNLTNALEASTTATGMIGKKSSDLDIIKFVNATNKLNMNDPIQASLQKTNMDIITKLGPLVSQAFGRAGLEAPLKAQADIESRKKEAGASGVDALTTRQATLAIEEKYLANQSAELANRSLISSYYDSDLQKQKESLSQEQSTNKFLQDTGKISQDIIHTRTALKYASGEEETKLLTSLANLENKQAATTQEYTIRNATIAITGIKDRMAGEESLRKIIADRLNTEFQLNSDLSSAKLSQEEATLKYLTDIGAITASESTNRQASIALDQQNLAYKKEEFALTQKYDTDRIAAANALNLVIEANKTRLPDRQVDTTQEQAQVTAVNNEYTRRLDTMGLINSTKVQTITLDAAHKSMLDLQAESMAKMVDVTSSLTTLFGDMGTNIGKVGEAILNMAQTDEKYVIAKLAAQEKLTSAETAYKAAVASGVNEVDLDKAHQDKVKAQTSLSTIEKKNEKDKLSGIASIAGATKKMFAEHTVAYKVLDGVEKVSQAYKMAMLLKELSIEGALIMTKVLSGEAGVASSAAEGTAEAAVLPIKMAGASAKLVSQAGWLGFAGIAALIAIVASFGFGGGGGVSAPSQAEVDQNNRNTGTGGVFGDATAVDKGIKNSLDLMAGAAQPQLENTSIMVKLLASIDSNTAGAVNALISSGFTQQITDAIRVNNVNSGAGGISFDPTQTLQSAATKVNAGIFISGTQTIDPGFFSKNYDAPFRKGLGEVDSALQRTLSDMFGNAVKIITLAGTSLGATTDKVTVALNSTLDLTDVKLIGTTAEQAAQLGAAVGARISAIIDGIMGKTLDSFRIGSEETLLTVSRIVLGMDEAGIALAGLGIKAINFKDVINTQAEDIGAEITRQSIMNTESYLQSVTKTINIPRSITQLASSYTTTTIEPILNNIGKIIDTLTGSSTDIASAYTNLKDLQATLVVLGFSSDAVSINLIKGAGSIDLLSTGISNFTDNFTTGAEKTAIKQAKLDLAFSRIGEVTPTTAQGFRDLVDSLKAAGASSLEQLGRVLALAPQVAEFTGAIDTASKAMTTAERDIAAHNLDIELATAKGLTNIALLMSQADKIISLNGQDPTGILAGKQSLIDAQNALNKTDNLQLELLNAQRNSTEALAVTRRNELKALSATDAAIKQQIYNAQDLAKFNDARLSQESQIYTLLGNSAAALQITREKELSTMDARLVPTQLYIYALQDEATLKNRLTTSVKSNISSLQGFIKSLKDARDALLLGQQSILTPADKYKEAKSQVDALVEATKSSDLTVRNDALSKLPAVTSTFLDASRELYASSTQYTQDFNSVLDILAKTGASLTAQESDAQKQLTALNAIDDSSESIARDTALLLESAIRVENARLTASASGFSIGASSAYMQRGATADTSFITGTTGTLLSFSDLKQQIVTLLDNDASAGTASALYNVLTKNGVSSLQIAEILGIPQSQVLAWSNSYGFPAFANGGLASGLAMVGEKGPELVDFRTPGRVYSNKASNDLLSNKELIQEIKSLRNEVSQLRADQKEQTGHLIASNYDANNKAATKIADTTENATATAIWNERSKFKVA